MKYLQKECKEVRTARVDEWLYSKEEEWMSMELLGPSLEELLQLQRNRVFSE